MCRLIASLLGTKRCEVSAVVSYEGALTESLRATGANVYCPQRTLTGGELDGAAYLDEVLRRCAPDIVHFNAIEPTSLMLPPILRGVPVVQHVRVAEVAGLGRRLNYTDALVAVSEFVGRELRKLDVPRDLIAVIHNGVDCGFFTSTAADRHTARQKLGIGAGEFVVLTVARFTPSKRLDVVLEAARKVADTIPCFRLIVVGEPVGEHEHYQALITLIERLRIGRYVTFIPFTTDIRALHSAADALLLPSERDPLPRAVLEAMAMSVVPVVADSGGCPEIVHHDLTGVVVKPGSVTGFANAVVGLALDPTSRLRLAARARDHVVGHFSIQAHAERMVALFRRVLHERSGSW